MTDETEQPLAFCVAFLRVENDAQAWSPSLSLLSADPPFPLPVPLNGIQIPSVVILSTISLEIYS